ncbi:hypothetical protein DU19_0478 [Chlamydia muridarum]|nr:hypothetical protein TAC_02285 [Chlamydia muridarum str. Nigg3 CMUT3-5]AHH23749.1 hypothetical protein Y015_02285 [Chlamydia muridarum str. Nigg CM972]KDU80347.1 hypothetical protein DU17_0480 [Chlamydia muridarum]KDU81442.1 hypothetical protein DU18_0480 [Chlamydia muridarum]KDU82470.1 hypothetical protein DU19_0478 [Chlamydia muridarum]
MFHPPLFFIPRKKNFSFFTGGGVAMYNQKDVNKALTGMLRAIVERE